MDPFSTGVPSSPGPFGLSEDGDIVSAMLAGLSPNPSNPSNTSPGFSPGSPLGTSGSVTDSSPLPPLQIPSDREGIASLLEGALAQPHFAGFPGHITPPPTSSPSSTAFPLHPHSSSSTTTVGFSDPFLSQSNSGGIFADSLGPFGSSSNSAVTAVTGASSVPSLSTTSSPPLKTVNPSPLLPDRPSTMDFWFPS